MGQNQSRAQPFLALIKHFLSRGGSRVSRCQLRTCLDAICECNPWFPGEGTLEEAIWEHTHHNMEKAYRQGEKTPVEFWVTWVLVKNSNFNLGGEC